MAQSIAFAGQGKHHKLHKIDATPVEHTTWFVAAAACKIRGRLQLHCFLPLQVQRAPLHGHHLQRRQTVGWVPRQLCEGKIRPKVESKNNMIIFLFRFQGSMLVFWGVDLIWSFFKQVCREEQCVFFDMFLHLYT